MKTSTPEQGLPQIRIATPEDVEELAGLAARTFEAAFGDDNKPADMEAYLEAAFSQTQMRSEIEEASNRFLLAVLPAQKAPIGYAKLRSGNPEPALKGSRPLELERIYVDPSAIGTGVGARLMSRCLAEAKNGGFDSVWLGVWQKNDRAVAFYRRFGFEVVGSRVFVLGKDHQNDHVMELPLATADQNSDSKHP